WIERDAEIEVEVAARRRHPAEGPAHALPVGLELGKRAARDGHESRVARRQMHVDAVEIVGPERAAGATLVPVRTEHEVLNDELTASAEEVGERDRSLGRLEYVGLVDSLPRKRPALARQFLPLMGEGPLLGEQRLAFGKPFLVRDNAVCRHAVLPRKST